MLVKSPENEQYYVYCAHQANLIYDYSMACFNCIYTDMFKKNLMKSIGPELKQILE